MIFREFHHEEEPKAWQNSYEVSDHLTSDETGSTIHSGQKSDIQISYNSTILPSRLSSDGQASQSMEIENKENILIVPNMTTNFNEMRMRASMDGLEAESLSRLSGSLRLEHSLDITLFDSEKAKYRRSLNKLRPSNERISDTPDVRNLVSFTLSHNELNQFNRSNVDKEETINFMHKSIMEDKMVGIPHTLCSYHHYLALPFPHYVRRGSRQRKTKISYPIFSSLPSFSSILIVFNCLFRPLFFNFSKN